MSYFAIHLLITITHGTQHQEGNSLLILMQMLKLKSQVVKERSFAKERFSLLKTQQVGGNHIIIVGQSPSQLVNCE